jgi:hypothetical protein
MTGSANICLNNSLNISEHYATLTYKELSLTQMVLIVPQNKLYHLINLHGMFTKAVSVNTEAKRVWCLELENLYKDGKCHLSCTNLAFINICLYASNVSIVSLSRYAELDSLFVLTTQKKVTPASYFPYSDIW